VRQSPNCDLCPPHRPAHHLAAEQIDDHRQEQPAFLGGDVGDFPSPGLVGPGGGEVAVQQIRCHRQIMPASGGHPETPLGACTDAEFLHQPLDTLLAHPNAALHQFPPDPRPAEGSPMFRVHCADVRQQRRIRQMPTPGDLPPPGWPDSTSRTASCLNSSVYLLRFPFLIQVSLSAI
jgi:hypothetical protein